MNWDYVRMMQDLSLFGVPEDSQEKAHQFANDYNEWRGSNSTCCHLSEGWFILYDFPRAERWAQECSWKPKVRLCQDSNYTLIHFDQPGGSVEMKLRWHNA